MTFSRFDKDFKREILDMSNPVDNLKYLGDLSKVKVQEITPIQANSIDYKGRQLCQK